MLNCIAVAGSSSQELKSQLSLGVSGNPVRCDPAGQVDFASLGQSSVLETAKGGSKRPRFDLQTLQFLYTLFHQSRVSINDMHVEQFVSD